MGTSPERPRDAYHPSAAEESAPRGAGCHDYRIDGAGGGFVSAGESVLAFHRRGVPRLPTWALDVCTSLWRSSNAYAWPGCFPSSCWRRWYRATGSRRRRSIYGRCCSWRCFAASSSKVTGHSENHPSQFAANAGSRRSAGLRLQLQLQVPIGGRTQTHRRGQSVSRSR